MQFSVLCLFVNVAFGDCQAENPNTSYMTDSFKKHYDAVADAGTIDQLTGGTAHFREYVQTCQSGEATAVASNHYEHEDDYLGDMSIANKIGGTTMFYNNKVDNGAYGGDLLVIPSNYFEVVNKAKDALSDGDFQILLKALVESGLYKAIRDGDKGQNAWPDVDHLSVLSDSQGGDREEFGYIYFCLHLEGNTTINWMHMHVFQSPEWKSSDNLWSAVNTCAKLKKPAATGQYTNGWDRLIHSEGVDDFTAAVEQVATCLAANYGNGQTGLVADFDTCGANNVSSSDATTPVSTSEPTESESADSSPDHQNPKGTSEPTESASASSSQAQQKPNRTSESTESESADRSQVHL